MSETKFADCRSCGARHGKPHRPSCHAYFNRPISIPDFVRDDGSVREYRRQ